ncbi:MAG: L,D-transpeptidase [Thermoanaerobacteraceae bacterium]|nr:L,D-transpeptidase [Thermoanaerobacteraceae bacterium]
MRKVRIFSWGLLLVLFLGILLATGAVNEGRESAGAPATEQGIQDEGEQGKKVAAGEQEAPPSSPQEDGEVSPPVDKPGEGEEGGGENAPPQGREKGNGDGFVPPSKGYWIEVVIAEQRVRIYHDGALIKDWPASTGTPDKPTPTGVFAIQNRGEWFFSEKYQQGGRWWVSFKDWGVYLFHSVPMDRQQNIIEAEAARLGTPASHGCVRLATENAKWIYDHVPQGAPVYIH